MPSAAIDQCTSQLCDLFNNKSFQPAQILGQFMLYHLDPSKLGELTALTAKKRTKLRSHRSTRASTLKKRKKSQLEEECGLHLECDSSEKEEDEDEDEDGEEIEHDEDDFDDDGSGQAPPPPPPEHEEHPSEDNSHLSSPEHRSTGVQSSSTSSNHRHSSNIYRFQAAQDSSDEDTNDRTLILARFHTHFPSLPLSPEM
ncbi:hypothetical protein Ciccas_005906 [Cichlidogyrus casuarinus]|uniref:Uncharacterized protein n=1 Tax=Cichlidogyrus casuarinus TaxID=1844966 RepID=A0ABD2Q7B3_9PLAT